LPRAAKRRRFAAHPEILAGVYRMFGVTGYGPIRDTDVMLLRHELYEMKMKLVPGTTHDTAHDAAHQAFPWADMVQDMVQQSTRRHGSSEETAVSPPPGRKQPLTLAESRAAAQTVQAGPDDLVLSKTTLVDNPTGPVLWL